MHPTLSQLHNQFVEECRYSAHLSEETLRGYVSSFALLERMIPSIRLESIDPATMTEFFRRLKRRKRVVGRGILKTGIRNTTVATYRCKLNAFFEWLRIKGLIPENPFRSMAYPRVQYETRQYLKREAVERIFLSVSFGINWKDEFLRKRNIAILGVFLHCGLRRGELIGLKMLDVDRSRRELTVRAETSKSRRRRIIPLNTSVLTMLDDYLEARAKRGCQTPSLFVSTNRDAGLTREGLIHWIKKVREHCGIPFHVHQFRHTFAVNLLNKGCDTAKVKQLLGHTDIRMTLTYLRCLPTKAMRADVERLDLDNLL